MPRTKKEAIKKTASKKTPVKRPAAKAKASPKAKSITIDVIADDEDILFREPLESLPADSPDERDGLDVQKKYFSDLVTDMKTKKEDKQLYGSLPVSEDHRPKGSHRKSLNLYRRIAFQFIGLTFLLLLVVGYFFLPNLKITLHPSAEAIADSLTLSIASTTTETAAAETDGSRSVSGSLKSETLNADKVFETSGEEILGEEVAGEVTLHNDYTKAQPLVVKTRLLSSDNKLYRLKTAVTIPAGGTVKVEVYADSPSQEMAISPSRFTIPGLWLGLQDQIYGVSDTAFEYRHQVKHFVKQRDIDQALVSVKQTLADKAKSELEAMNDGTSAVAYSLDENATVFKVGAKLGDEVSEFTVSAENNLVVATFSKDQAEALVKAKIAFLLPDDKKLSSFSGDDDIEYHLDTYDIKTGAATVSANFNGSMSLRTDADIIDRKQLVNLNKEQISEYLNTFPEIESYNLEFFPKFINRAPSLADRIKVDVIQ